MPTIDTATTIVDPGTYTVSASISNERAGVTTSSISIEKDDAEIGSGVASPTTAQVTLTYGESGTFDIDTTGVDSLGRTVTDSKTWTYNIPDQYVLAVSQTTPFVERYTVTSSSMTLQDDLDPGIGTGAAYQVTHHQNGLVAMALHSDGIQIMQLESGTWSTLQTSFLGLSTNAYSVSFHPTDAKFLIIGTTSSSILSLYERITISGSDAYYLREYNFGSISANGSAKFSPDGEMIAVTSGTGVYTYQFDVSTGVVTAVDSLGFGQFTRALAWSNDSLYLAATCDTDSPRLKIWKRDIADDTMDALTIDLYHSKSIPTAGNNLAWHPDGEFLVIGSSDAESSIYVYQNDGDDTFSDVTSTVVDSQVGVGGRIYSVEWSLDGNLLVVGVGDFGVENKPYVVYSFDGANLTREYTVTGTEYIYDLHFAFFNGSTPSAVTIDNSSATTNTLEATGATLSSGDLNAAFTTSAQTARSVSRLQGKRYLEFNSSWNGLMIGVCSEVSPYGWNDTNTDSGHYYVATGANWDKLTGGTPAASPSDMFGNWCGYAIDVPNRKLWLRDKTGTWLDGDPAAGTGGWSFEFLEGNEVNLSLGLGGTSGNVTINFGATAFAHSVPTGFNT